MTKLHELAKIGQSIWYDNIRRALIESGELQELLDSGVVGVTSNPSIFEKAIAGSSDYDEAIRGLVADGKSVEEIYMALVLEDIGRTADLLSPIHVATDGVDGYVSLEVSPTLANDAEGTIDEGQRLFAALDRSNVMIKVPATAAGLVAIETLTGLGINVNVTLIFSTSSYEAVAEAYLAGLEKLVAGGGDPRGVASVASLFVSRVDSAVDGALHEVGGTRLRGKVAIANAKAAYQRFGAVFSGDRWERLESLGARPQRLLWASTGTKDPEYPDTLYIDALIGPHTVNTVPPAPLAAFMEHGTVAPTLTAGADEAARHLSRLAELGIDLEAVTQRLQDEGVVAFARSFESLMESLAAKRDDLLAGTTPIVATLGAYQPLVDAALAEMRDDQVLKRIWAHDHTVWKPDPDEIGNRLGWLHAPENMTAAVARVEALRDAAAAAGYTDVLLLGMGGSSLAAEVFSHSFGDSGEGLRVAILDSTDPGAVLTHDRALDPATTMYVVATKSGGTVETLSFFKYFYNRVLEAVGPAEAGDHFVAVTDPGSKLADLAAAHDFRALFINDPDIGGRYSALSYFGLVPAALAGVDVGRLLDRALTVACNSASCNCPVAGDNNAALLGAIMGELAKAGRDKLTLIASTPIESFGDWVEQLVAESTGKEGKGILPVVGESLGAPGFYRDDRLFVHLRLDGDESYDEAVAALEQQGHPIVRVRVRDPYDLGGQFFLWELATAVAGYRLGIQPFDQPNVEDAKVLAREMIAAYLATGELPRGEFSPATAAELTAFLERARPGDYLAIQAYVEPAAEIEDALQLLRMRARDRFRVATTLGYGPRFLHSTGQLHKGDAGNGLFLQLVSNPESDAPIPDGPGATESTLTFGALKTAQALGDALALRDAGRRVLRLQVGSDVHTAAEKIDELMVEKEVTA